MYWNSLKLLRRHKFMVCRMVLKVWTTHYPLLLLCYPIYLIPHVAPHNRHFPTTLHSTQPLLHFPSIKIRVAFLSRSQLPAKPTNRSSVAIRVNRLCLFCDSYYEELNGMRPSVAWRFRNKHLLFFPEKLGNAFYIRWKFLAFWALNNACFVSEEFAFSWASAAYETQSYCSSAWWAVC